jgi:hypothetical protein
MIMRLTWCADVEGALQIGLEAIFFNENRLETEDHIKQESFIRIKKKYIIMKKHLVFIAY